MRLQNPSRRVGGFSIVELLVTMAILGILMATGLPYYRQYVAEIQVDAMMKQMETLKIEHEAYFQEHGRFPTRSDNYNTAAARILRGEDDWPLVQYWAWGSPFTSRNSGRTVGPWQVQLLHGHIDWNLHPDLTGRNDVLMMGVPDEFGNVVWTCGYHWIGSIQKLPPSLMPPGCDRQYRGMNDFD